MYICISKPSVLTDFYLNHFYCPLRLYPIHVRSCVCGYIIACCVSTLYIHDAVISPLEERWNFLTFWIKEMCRGASEKVKESLQYRAEFPALQEIQPFFFLMFPCTFVESRNSNILAVLCTLFVCLVHDFPCVEHN